MITVKVFVALGLAVVTLNDLVRCEGIEQTTVIPEVKTTPAEEQGPSSSSQAAITSSSVEVHSEAVTPSTSVEVQGETPLQTTMIPPRSTSPTTAKAEEPPIKYVGQPIPTNCTAFYSCCDMRHCEDGDCIKWCVKKVTCNKRLVLVRVPSYVEIATDAPIVETSVGSDIEEEPKQTEAKEENKNNVKTIGGIKAVQVIDVPCVSGSLPDRTGRCREVW